VTNASVSLDAHRSTSSSDDVSINTGVCCFVCCLNSPTYVFHLIDFDEEVRLFGH
jgi:hypothetical protein